MKYTIFFILLLSIFISGCSTRISQPQLDNMKSCQALEYEIYNIKNEIKKLDPNDKKEVSLIHYGVVGVGIIASIPLLLETGFYIIPGMTIAYYNNFIGYDKKSNKLEYLNKREEILKQKQRKKNCKKNQ
jgi:hypothetical protein